MLSFFVICVPSPYYISVMSEKKLSVLYLTDNNYAAYAGVSIVSLFENNKHLDGIKVYVIDDNISDDNKAKMQEAAQNYGREIIFLDVSSGIKKLEAIGAPKYRDSYTTYLKLFAFGMLPDEDERVFFIDSDSVVVGKADEILEVRKRNAVCAGTYRRRWHRKRRALFQHGGHGRRHQRVEEEKL